MISPAPVASYESLPVEALLVRRQVERRRRTVTTRREDPLDRVVDPWSYLAKLGRGVLRLGSVEFRILQFLAANPYRAYSRQRIAEAVSTSKEPVAADAVPAHIRSLRSQLGFSADYVQRVPYLGYRFKS